MTVIKTTKSKGWLCSWRAKTVITFRNGEMVTWSVEGFLHGLWHLTTTMFRLVGSLSLVRKFGAESLKKTYRVYSHNIFYR